MPPPLIFFTAGMLSLFSKGTAFNKLHFCTKMKFLPCTVTKIHIWQLLGAILFFLHNLVKMLAEINEHACVKLCCYFNMKHSIDLCFERWLVQEHIYLLN